MALLPWRTGTIIRVENETPTTKRFWVEVPELSNFDFTPGQFITMDLPIDTKPNKRLRSYSIASWPNGTNVFELIIVLDRQGAGTHFIFDHLTTGSTIKFRGPQGVFKLKEPLTKDIFLVCTGTGIAPFRSMVHHIFEQGIAHQHIWLIFGCRTQADLLYHDEMKSLQEKMPGFSYIPVLSREKWEGRTGYVHAVYEELCADRKPAGFFLCGWKGMVDEATARILDMGYAKPDIHTEIYG